MRCMLNHTFLPFAGQQWSSGNVFDTMNRHLDCKMRTTHRGGAANATIYVSTRRPLLCCAGGMRAPSVRCTAYVESRMYLAGGDLLPEARLAFMARNSFFCPPWEPGTPLAPATNAGGPACPLPCAIGATAPPGGLAQPARGACALCGLLPGMLAPCPCVAGSAAGCRPPPSCVHVRIPCCGACPCICSPVVAVACLAWLSKRASAALPQATSTMFLRGRGACPRGTADVARLRGLPQAGLGTNNPPGAWEPRPMAMIPHKQSHASIFWPAARPSMLAQPSRHHHPGSGGGAYNPCIVCAFGPPTAAFVCL